MVRSWHTQRTDLTYLPDPHGQPVFINSTTIATATLLRDLANTQGTTIPRPALPQQFTQQFLRGHPNNQTTPQPPHAPHLTKTPTTRQINKALDALYKLGAIHHNRQHITITDLARIATL